MTCGGACPFACCTSVQQEVEADRSRRLQECVCRRQGCTGACIANGRAADLSGSALGGWRGLCSEEGEVARLVGSLAALCAPCALFIFRLGVCLARVCPTPLNSSVVCEVCGVHGVERGAFEDISLVPFLRGRICILRCRGAGGLSVDIASVHSYHGRLTAMSLLQVLRSQFRIAHECLIVIVDDVDLSGCGGALAHPHRSQIRLLPCCPSPRPFGLPLLCRIRSPSTTHSLESMGCRISIVLLGCTSPSRLSSRSSCSVHRWALGLHRPQPRRTSSALTVTQHVHHDSTP